MSFDAFIVGPMRSDEWGWEMQITVNKINAACRWEDDDMLWCKRKALSLFLLSSKRNFSVLIFVDLHIYEVRAVASHLYIYVIWTVRQIENWYVFGWNGTCHISIPSRSHWQLKFSFRCIRSIRWIYSDHQWSLWNWFVTDPFDMNSMHNKICNSFTCWIKETHGRHPERVITIIIVVVVGIILLNKTNKKKSQNDTLKTIHEQRLAECEPSKHLLWGNMDKKPPNAWLCRVIIWK